jgi:hypothetical protein
MKYKILVLILAIQFLACNKEEETLTGSLIGKLTMDVGNDLSGIKIELENKCLKKETFTDDKGIFSFDNLVRDYYDITVSKVGYDTIRFTEIILGNGKPNISEIYLHKSVTLVAI